MITRERNRVNCNYSAKRSYARSVLGISPIIVANTTDEGLDALVWSREQTALIFDEPTPPAAHDSLLAESLDEHAATLTFLTGRLVTEQHLTSGAITWNGEAV